MKTANVIEVRDLGPLTPLDQSDLDCDPARIERMADLLRRYPEIGEAEKAEILLFLKEGRQIEIGLVSTREGIASRLMKFRQDHRAHFRLSPLQILGFVAVIVGPLVGLAWVCFG